MEPADESAPADNGSKRKRKADAKKGGKKPRQDARVEPVVEPKLGWDGGEDGLAEGWPVKSIPDPVPGCTPFVVRKGPLRCPSRMHLGKLSPKARAMAGRTPNGKKTKAGKPVVKKTLLWQGPS